MRGKNFITTFFICILLTNFSAMYALDQILTLQNFLLNAIKNDKVKQLVLEEKSLTANYELSKEMDDWVFSINAGSTLLISNGNAMKPSIEIVASKLNLDTGTQLSAAYSRSFSSTSSKDLNKVSMALSQPLIQNHFGYQKILKDSMLKQTRVLSRIQIIESYETYYAELMKLYYDWYLAYIEKESATQLYNDYELLYQDILKRKKNHIAREIDVNKVKVQLLEKRENLMDQRSNFKTVTEKILNELNTNAIDSTIPSLPESNSMEIFKEMDVLLLKSRTESALNIEAMISSMNAELAQDDLKMPLNFEASYQLTSYPDGSSSDQSTLYSGLSLAIPFYTGNEKASAVLSQQSNRQLILVQQDTRREWVKNLKELQRSITDENAYLEIYLRKEEYLQSIAYDEKENYLRGLASLNELIQAMSNLELARKKSVSHQVLLEKQKIDWLNLTDQLLISVL